MSSDRDPYPKLVSRAQELKETLASRIVVAAIDQTGDDGAQLIFDTLNDLGTPRLKVDFIKNWVCRQGVKLKADIGKWQEVT